MTTMKSKIHMALGIILSKNLGPICLMFCFSTQLFGLWLDKSTKITKVTKFKFMKMKIKWHTSKL